VHHCLNKRNSNATQNYESEDIPQKLQERREGQSQELQNVTDARRRKALKRQEEFDQIWLEHGRET